MRSLFLLCGVLLLGACSDDDSASDSAAAPPSTLAGEDGGGITADGGPGNGNAGPDVAAIQKHTSQMLTSFWENDTTVFQYAFSRNNNDGYGYTSGRIGFTTATGDAYQIVKCFDAAYTGAGNVMKKYEAPLAALYAKKMSTGMIQGDISTLDAVGNFPTDWKATVANPATAPAFEKCQDDRVDASYWVPAVALTKQWGLTTALARASFYDATVVHGETNVKNLIKQANNDIGNTAQAVPTGSLSLDKESEFLGKFLARRTVLMNSSGAWRGSIARGANYEQQRRNGNFEFDKDIVTNATADVVFPGNGYSSRGYQACVIKPDGHVEGEPQCTAPVSN